MQTVQMGYVAALFAMTACGCDTAMSSRGSAAPIHSMNDGPGPVRIALADSGCSVMFPGAPTAEVRTSYAPDINPAPCTEYIARIGDSEYRVLVQTETEEFMKYADEALFARVQGFVLGRIERYTGRPPEEAEARIADYLSQLSPVRVDSVHGYRFFITVLPWGSEQGMVLLRGNTMISLTASTPPGGDPSAADSFLRSLMVQ